MPVSDCECLWGETEGGDHECHNTMLPKEEVLENKHATFGKKSLPGDKVESIHHVNYDDSKIIVCHQSSTQHLTILSAQEAQATPS